MKIIGYTKDLFIGLFEMFLPGRNYVRNMLIQSIYFYTTNSLGVTLFVAVFMGAALTSQLIPELKSFGAEVTVGNMIMLSMSREIGAIILGLILSGRMGSSMTAELGSMNSSNQIDSLKLMAVNPVRYLAAPRVIAATIISPFLFMVFLFLVWSVMQLISGLFFDISYGEISMVTAEYFLFRDIVGGILKTSIFGFVISFISCYKGIFIKGRSGEIGKATTDAVAYSIISIIMFNLVITYLFFL